MIDLAVMNSARRAVAGRGKRPMRWLGAFATATVVVLALTLVIEQEQQAPVPILEEGDGFRLERAAPASEKRDNPNPGEPQGKLEQAVRKVTGEEAASSELRMKQSVAPRPAQAAETEPMADAEEEYFSSKVQNDVSEADAWIERMLELRKSDRPQELARELAAFREAYPDYPLPPALQD